MTNLDIMTPEFTANCEKNRLQLAELFEAFDLAKLGRKIDSEREVECYNEALALTPFYASKDFGQRGPKVGERVIRESDVYSLSDDDFERLLKCVDPIFVREGITDADGCYVTNWLVIVGDARRALVDFIIDTLLPKPLRIKFSDYRLNVTQANRLIDIVRPIVQTTNNQKSNDNE